MAIRNSICLKIHIGCKLGKVLQIRHRAEKLAFWMKFVAWLNIAVIVFPHSSSPSENILPPYWKNTSQDTESAKSRSRHPAKWWHFIFILYLFTPRNAWPLCTMCWHLSVWPVPPAKDVYQVLRQTTPQKLLWK